MKDPQKKPEKAKAQESLADKAFMLIKARTKKDKALFLDFGDGGPKIYKAYCRTHRNLNDPYVERAVMEQTMRQHKAANPTCIVSFKELVRDEA